jgi:diguanylate cyclase (GGDEF)-like protein
MILAGDAQPLSILLVEDYRIDAMLLTELLEQVPAAERPSVVHVQSVADAERELGNASYDCVLLDLGLPDGDGVENVQRVRGASRHAAIVVMTGLDDDQRAIEALRLGAQEYLVKGRLNHSDLMRQLHRAVQRNRLVADLDRDHQQQKLQAAQDPLTGLVNRHMLSQRIDEASVQAREHGERFALCFLDLDGFKAVNDRLGHAAGDAVLIEVAKALQSVVRTGDTVARVGGDEFVVMLAPVRDEDDVHETSARLIAAVRTIRRIEGQDIVLDVSVGAALYPEDGEHPAQLLCCADERMYRVKRGEGGGARLRAAPATRPAPPPDQTRADPLTLVYQPWTLAGTPVGVEALLRQHRSGRWELPEELLRTADHAGSRRGLAPWILRTACAQWGEWRESLGIPARLAVNISAVDAAHPDFPQAVAEALAERLPASELQIEIAETLLQAPSRRLHEHLAALRTSGVRVVVDRFGCGPASLRSLLDLPIDGVKIDASIVHGLNDADPRPRAMMAGIIASARVQGLEVVAVGVENEAQALACLDLGCPSMQGHWFAAPVRAEHLPGLLNGTVAEARLSWSEGAARAAIRP